MDARMRAADAGVQVVDAQFHRADADAVVAEPLHVGAQRASSSSSVRTSRMSGTFSRTTSSSVRSAAAMMGRAAFLLPAGRMVPLSGRPPSTTYFGIGYLLGVSARS
jgi:uncharacterized oligopeptide transporter (OPT) family protein